MLLINFVLCSAAVSIFLHRSLPFRKLSTSSSCTELNESEKMTCHLGGKENMYVYTCCIWSRLRRYIVGGI